MSSRCIGSVLQIYRGSTSQQNHVTETQVHRSFLAVRKFSPLTPELLSFAARLVFLEFSGPRISASARQSGASGASGAGPGAVPQEEFLVRAGGKEPSIWVAGGLEDEPIVSTMRSRS